eukprot:1010808-Pyramimonas_sp.AAC.2
MPEAERAPETDVCLRAQLALEGAQRRVRVGHLVAPCGARAAVLEEHPDDGRPGQAAFGQLRAQGPL